jgi:predicted AlkP superfamily pyrophosphatase or phosphodiesterase
MGDRVLVISIDGLRPDLLLRANTPNLKALFGRGSYSFWAQTTEVSITLPSHVSMMTGVAPWKHGVDWNEAVSPIKYPKFPTLFEVARKNRPQLTTAVAAGKFKFNTFTKPGVCDWAYLPDEKYTSSDLEVADEAAKIIDAHAPNILFVHFANVDHIGHADTKKFPPERYGYDFGGWGSPDQMEAINRADTAVGIVLKALESKGVLSQTLVIVSADHGGQGRGHGKDDPRSRHIPWIIAGPKVRKDFDLTRIAEVVINTEDTFATASYFLGLQMDPAIDGRPVLEVFQQSSADSK